MKMSFGELDLDNILEYVNNDGKLTYSFLIDKDLDLENPYAFENLHMVKVQDDYLGYILRWEPNHEWFENNEFIFSLEHFTGKQLHYDLDYNLLQETYFAEGLAVVNEGSSKNGSGKHSKSMDMEIVCVESVSSLCNGVPYDCGGSICGFGVESSCFLAYVGGGGGGTGGGDDSGTPESGGGTRLPRTGDDTGVVDDGEGTVVVDEPEWSSTNFLIDLFGITDPEVKVIFYDTAFSDAFYSFMKREYFSQEAYEFAVLATEARLNGNMDDYENEFKIFSELIENPFLLIQIDCNEIQNWQTLAQHTAPLGVQNKIKFLPSSFTNDFEIQPLGDANGTMVNLDFFSVSVTNLPNNPNTNNQFTADEFLDYIRRNFNDFVDGSTFEPYCEIDSMCQTETDLWYSNNPVGSIIYIDIPGDDGVVACTEYTNSYWYFMTMNAPYAGNHPVSGTRQFGYEQNSDGSYNFFVRGVDRIDSSIMELLAYVRGLGNPFFGADLLWESFQNKTRDFVNNNQGTSTIVPAITDNRPDWDKVEQVLMGELPISELGCN